MKGNVKVLMESKWYGFITVNGQNDLFFHANNFEWDFNSLNEGDSVEFDIADGRKPGTTQAINVTLV